MARPSLRQRIVDAALERFLAQGFNGCSVQDITDAAGAPKGSFYNHFKTKESLALEVLDRYCQARPAILCDQNLPPLERLRRHFEGMADRHEQSGFADGCMIGNFGVDMAGSSPDMCVALNRAFDLWAATIALVLEEAGHSKESAVELAGFLVNAWEGAVIRMRILKSRAPLELFLKMAFDRVLARP